MPISALERLRQLKAQGTPTSTPSGKSALERLRELKSGQAQVQAPPAPTPPAYLQQPKQAPIGSFGAVKQQNNILSNPTALTQEKTFQVPENMRQAESSGDLNVKDMATGIVKTLGETALRSGTSINPLFQAIPKNIIPEDINISKISADLAREKGVDPKVIEERMNNLPDELKQDISIKYSEDPKKALGQAVNDLTNIYGGGAFGTLKNVSKPFARGVLLPIVGLTEGGAISSISAAGSVLEKNGTFRDAYNAGKEAFFPGAAFGAVLSPLAIGATLSKTEKATMQANKLQKTEQKLAAKAEQTQQKVVQKVKEGWENALDVRTKRLQNFEESAGKTLPEAMVDQQLPGLKKTKQGYIDAKDTEKAARESVQKLETTKQEIFNTRKQADIDIDQVAEEAKRRINDPNDLNYIVNAEDAEKSIEDIDSYVNAFKRRKGNSIFDVKLADEAKKGAWESAYEDLRPTKDKALRTFGNTLKDTIESKFVAGEQNIIKQINKEEGTLLGIIKALDVKGGMGVHGRVVRGGVLGKKFDELTGSYIGSMTGIPVIGPLAGAKLAEKLNSYRLDPSRLTKNAVKELQQAGVIPKWVNTQTEALVFLRSKQADNIINSYKPKMLALPAAKEGSPKFGGGAIPEGGDVVGLPPVKKTQFEAPAQKIGNQASDMQSGVAKKAMDAKEVARYEQSVIEEVRKGTPIGFVGQMEDQYQKFVDVLKNKKVAFKKEAIQSGDIESITSALKNVMPEKDIQKMFYSQDMTGDEMLELFRSRLQREKPGLLNGQKVSENLGYKREIPPASELFGAIGGFEIQTDENGKRKVVFNEKKAIASMMLVAGITRPKAQEALKKFTSKDFKSLFKEGVHRKIDEAIEVTQNLVNKNKATMDEYSELLEAKKLLDSGKITDKQVEDAAILMKLKGVDPTQSDKRVFTTKKLPAPKKVSLPVSKELEPLYEEAKKYKSAEEFIDAQPIKKDQLKGSMQHRPSFDQMPPAYDLLKFGSLPDDVYTHPDYSIGNGAIRRGEKAANESWNVLQKIKGKPEAEVTIYRATPKNELRTGDWVTLSKTYAKQESLNEGVKVHEFRVKAKDIIFAGDDINEFGYWGHSTSEKEKLNKIFEQVRGSDVTRFKNSNDYIDHMYEKGHFDKFKTQTEKYNEEMKLTDIWNKANKN